MPVAGTLPTSGRRVVAREPVGHDELVALDGAGSPLRTMLALAERVVGGGGDWLDLPGVDLAAVALLIRAAWIGDVLRTDGTCSAPGCAGPVEIAFPVDAYLEHHRPRPARGAVDVGEGWFELVGTGAAAAVRFRIPTVADLLAGGDLAERCVGAGAAPATVRRVERALDALAPTLSGMLGGSCPECGATIELWFDPVDYVLAELRDASSSLLGQVHELACAYHWSEPAILALGRRRRHGYVELVRRELVA